MSFSWDVLSHPWMYLFSINSLPFGLISHLDLCGRSSLLLLVLWVFHLLLRLCVVRFCSQMLRCNPMNCSPPGSSVHRISQARTLEWVAISFLRGSSRPRHWTCISYLFCIGRWVFTTSTTWEVCISYISCCILPDIYMREKGQGGKASYSTQFAY